MPQNITRLSEVEAFEAIAQAQGATFREVVLLDDRDAALARRRLADAGVIVAGPDGWTVDYPALRRAARTSEASVRTAAPVSTGLTVGV